MSAKSSNFAVDLFRTGSIKLSHNVIRHAEKPVKQLINAMYAIVEINGQQFKVEQGKKLFVNHIKDVEAGKTVEFDKVLLVDKEGSVQVGAPTVSGAKVVCEVVNPLVPGSDQSQPSAAAENAGSDHQEEFHRPSGRRIPAETGP